MDRSATPTSARPREGIATVQLAKGWIGKRWIQVLGSADSSHHGAMARGRTWARSGRVRDLWFAPGMAAGEVSIGSDESRVSIRVEVFSDKQWDRVVARLRSNLIHIAAMLEGEFPPDLLEQLEQDGLDVFPSARELHADCDCADYRLPCAHMVAVHHVIADALDGDPFGLLTLRGRTREQLLAALRRAWGDHVPMGFDRAEATEPPPEADWAESPEPLSRPKFLFRETTTEAAGLRALGPPPGEADLARALGPLYVAGARAAHALALAERAQENAEAPRHRRRRETQVEEVVVAPPSDAPTEPGTGTLTEQLVDLLAKRESAKSKEIADALGADMAMIRAELLELEKLGIVYRTGQTRGTRWWLG